MNQLNLNVALRPIDALSAQAIKASEELAKQGDVFFTLNEINLLPHLTIQHIHIPEEYLEKFLHQVEKIASETSKVVTPFTNLHPVKGWLGVNVELTEQLTTLRKALLKFQPPQQKTPFIPHLTLTRYTDPQQAETMSTSFTWEPQTFEAEALVVYRLGEHGTCTEIIKSFVLS